MALKNDTEAAPEPVPVHPGINGNVNALAPGGSKEVTQGDLRAIGLVE